MAAGGGHQGLEKDLAEKGEEWRAARRAAGGVVTGGVDVASQSVDGAEEADGDLVRQVDAATFHAAVEEAEGLVVVDFYTQNCGPCRLMYPKVVEMANLFKVDGVTFLKMLCSRDNKEIGKAFKVRVAPTFVLLQGGKEVARMTGAHGESRRGPTARPATSSGGSHAATDPRLTGPPPRRPQPTNSSSWSRSTSK